MIETSSAKETANPKRQPLRNLQCPGCGTEFQAAHWRQANCSQACWQRSYTQRNRTKIHANTKSWRATRKQYVNADELEACLKDPRKARTIAGPDVIVCLECGEKLTQLGRHVKFIHGMTVAEYKQKPAPGGQIPRYSAKNPLSSTNLHDSRSKTYKRLRLGDQVAGYRITTGQCLIQYRGPQKMSLEFRLNNRDAQKGKGRQNLWKRTPEGRVVTDALIAKLRLEGMTIQDIARRVGIKGNGPTIHRRLHEIGFPPGFPCLFRYGEPITGRYIRDLCSDFGMTKKKMAEEMRVSYTYLNKRLCSDDPLPIRFAERVLIVRQRLVKQYHHKGAPKKSGRPLLIFPSQRISICASYKKLVKDLKVLQKWLKQKGKDVPMSMVWTWLCERSRDGTIRLLFWPEFLKWVTTDSYIDTKQLNHHSGGKLTETYTLPQVLAQNFLAKSYSVSEEKIRHTLKQGSPKQQAKKRLLEDILTIFNEQEKIPTAELVSAMKESDHSNWKDLTPRVLAGLLRPLRVKSRTIRLPGNRTPKGYKRKDLERALRSIAPQPR